MSTDAIKLDLELDTSNAVTSVARLEYLVKDFARSGGSGLSSLDRRLTAMQGNAAKLSRDFKQLNAISNNLFSNSRLNTAAQGKGRLGGQFSGIRTEAEAAKTIIADINQLMAQGLGADIARYRAMEKYRDVADELYRIQRQADRDRQLEAYTGMSLNERGTNRAQLMARKDELDSLANTRYALYDAAKTYLVLATAIAAPAVAVVKFNADYTKALASVRRVTNESAEDFVFLGESLVDLTTKMPIVIDEIARIATIGGQLGVATENLANFTSVVAMFSSTTDVGVEETAKGLGRVAQLTKTSGSAYENLGSAIYQVGVTSVATEQEILKLSSEIATSGDLAGFTNAQIIGLAGSLASLGVKPEAARGSLMRIFDTITRGAADGGAALASIADIAGMSMAEIQATWGTDSQRVFTAFVEGLGRAQDAGENTNKMLKDLGIYAVRDIRTLQVLANNTELYADLLDQSNKGYAAGNSLREGFATQMDNLADKFQILQQTITAISAAAGEGLAPVLTTLLEAMQAVASSILDLTRSPAGATLLGMATAAGVAVSSFLAWQAVMLLLRASVAALTSSAAGLRAANANLGGSFTQLIGKLVVVSREMMGSKVASDSLAASFANTGRAAVTAGGAAQVAGNAFRTMGKAGGIIIAVSLAIEGLFWAIDGISEAMKTNQQRAEDYFGSFDSIQNAIKQDTEVWRETGNAISTMTREVESSSDTLSAGAQALDTATGGQINFETAVKDTTTAVREQTIALGEQTQAAVANALASNEAFMELYSKYGDALKAGGFDLGAYMNAQLNQRGGEYIDTLLPKLEAFLLTTDKFATTEMTGEGTLFTTLNQDGMDLIIRMKELQAASAGLDESFEKAAITQQFMAEANAALGGALFDTESEITKIGEAVDGMTQSLDAALSTQEAFQSIANTMADNGSAFDTYSEAGVENMRVLQDAVKTFSEAAGDDAQAFLGNLFTMTAQMQDSGAVMGSELDWLFNVMQSTFGPEWGLAFDSSAARTDIRAFIADAIYALEVRAQMERSRLSGPGVGYAAQVAGGAELTKIDAQINALKGIQTQILNNNTKATDKNTKSRNNNTGSAKKAAKEVRTLSDYIKDLSSVADSAFDFRFGLAQSERALKKMQDDILEYTKSFEAYAEVFESRLFNVTALGSASDEIASSIYSMSDSFADAEKRIRDSVNKIQDLMASLQENAADRQSYEYGLQIAEMYGDELRAAEIRAKLAKLDADRADIQANLADAQEALVDAQESASRSLTGTSEAAIRNRKDVSALVSEYLDYIKTVQESGSSQADVSEAIEQAQSDFLAQATALGFSRVELQKYMNILTPVTSKQLAQTNSVMDAEAKMEDLTKAWSDYIIELVESGAPMSKVNDAIKMAKTNVQSLGSQLGLSKKQIDPFVAALNDVKTVIDRIPKNLTVNADLSPAQRAIEDWRKKNTGGNGLSAGVKIPFTASVPKTNAGSAKRLAAYVETMNKYANLIKGTTNMSALTEYSRKWAQARDAIMRGGYRQGGYTGTGAANQVAGVVHKGEYVFRKELVNQQTGLPYMDAFMRVAKGYQGGGYVTSAPTVRQTMPSRMIVELSPTDRALLSAAGNVEVTLDGRVIARSVNQHNSTGNTRGNN